MCCIARAVYVIHAPLVLYYVILGHSDDRSELVGVLTLPAVGSATHTATPRPRQAVLLVHGGMANKSSFYHKVPLASPGCIAPPCIICMIH